MSSDHDNHETANLALKAAVAAALDRLDHLFMANGVLEGLTRDILVNCREARGVDAAAAQMARALVDQRTTAIREAIGRFSKMVAPEREPEAVGALSEFNKEVIESLTFGNLADVDRRLIGFSYTINRFSAPSVGPTSSRPESRRHSERIVFAHVTIAGVLHDR